MKWEGFSFKVSLMEWFLESFTLGLLAFLEGCGEGQSQQYFVGKDLGCGSRLRGFLGLSLHVRRQLREQLREQQPLHL